MNINGEAHEFADEDITICFTRPIPQGYIQVGFEEPEYGLESAVFFDKKDIIAMAKAVGVTGGDLDG